MLKNSENNGTEKIDLVPPPLNRYHSGEYVKVLH